MEVDIARESFLRINNLHLVTLASKVEKDLKDPSRPREIILGDILAYEGKFMEAEKLYCRNSKIELAIQMCGGCRQFLRIGLDWIGLDWIGLDWIGLDWIDLD